MPVQRHSYDAVVVATTVATANDACLLKKKKLTYSIIQGGDDGACAARRKNKNSHVACRTLSSPAAKSPVNKVVYLSCGSAPSHFKMGAAWFGPL